MDRKKVEMLRRIRDHEMLNLSHDITLAQRRVERADAELSHSERALQEFLEDTRETVDDGVRSLEIPLLRNQEVRLRERVRSQRRKLGDCLRELRRLRQRQQQAMQRQLQQARLEERVARLQRVRKKRDEQRYLDEITARASTATWIDHD